MTWSPQGTGLAQILAHAKGIRPNCMCLFDEDKVVSVGEDQYLRLWNINSKQMLKEVKADHDFLCCALVKEQSRKMGYQVGQIITSCAGGGLRLWNLNKMTQIGTVQTKDEIIDIQQVALNVMACLGKNVVEIYEINGPQIQLNSKVDLNGLIYGIYTYTGNDIPTYEESIYRPVILWH